MIKNLETADTMVKLVLAGLVILFFSLDIITGPFARALAIIALLVIVIYGIKLLISSKSK